MKTDYAVGDVVLAAFPDQGGRSETNGTWPAVVLAMPKPSRFGMVTVAPLTTDRGQDWIKANPALYIQLPQGSGDLKVASIASLDQIRAIDPSRIVFKIGSLTGADLERIKEGLKKLFQI